MNLPCLGVTEKESDTQIKALLSTNVRTVFKLTQKDVAGLKKHLRAAFFNATAHKNENLLGNAAPSGIERDIGGVSALQSVFAINSKNEQQQFGAFLDEWIRKTEFDELLQEVLLVAVRARLEKDGLAWPLMHFNHRRFYYINHRDVPSFKMVVPETPSDLAIVVVPPMVGDRGSSEIFACGVLVLKEDQVTPSLRILAEVHSKSLETKLTTAPMTRNNSNSALRTTAREASPERQVRLKVPDRSPPRLLSRDKSSGKSQLGARNVSTSMTQKSLSALKRDTSLGKQHTEAKELIYSSPLRQRYTPKGTQKSTALKNTGTMKVIPPPKGLGVRLLK
eukprot:TRINITY_DN1101_c0_g1_i5.p1 TRINITY_DN1101_c0_g1~~TRINITY_DN1101_c0_g1_i5.p1  ORF type:complete len:336 (+),score=47.77 TRINITY_DN1101_c0_g1_i5:539-1546(+)